MVVLWPDRHRNKAAQLAASDGLTLCSSEDVPVDRRPGPVGAAGTFPANRQPFSGSPLFPGNPWWEFTNIEAKLDSFLQSWLENYH